MASRRDLIQGYQFAARRVVSAVVMRQTDPTEWPFRRLGGAGFGSLMMAIIALAAVGIYGMIVPGGKTSWKDGKTVVVEKETGASYVYYKGKLHPAYNFTSAALVVGSNHITSTAHSSLVDVPRGVEVGISGAPDSVPPEDKLMLPPWSFCTRQEPDRTTGKLVNVSSLVAGERPGRGDRPGRSALLVTDTADRSQHIIWHDQRYTITDPNIVRVALRLDNEVNVPVGDAWLKALPQGRDIGPMETAGSGASHAVPGESVGIGDVVSVQTQDKGKEYYLAGSDSMVPISELQAQIQEAAGADVQPVSPGAATDANKTTPPQFNAQQPPATRPDFIRPIDSNTTVCAAYRNNSFAPQILVNSTTPRGGGLPTERMSAGGTTLADRVWLPPGKAALVESMPSPKAKTGPLYLVTDQGRRYAIPSPDALRALGYTGKHLSKLPASLLVRVPEGPALDPDAARAALAVDE
ncbi:MAG: type VII secretion protein EccB [Actinocatenispora sp.]